MLLIGSRPFESLDSKDLLSNFIAEPYIIEQATDYASSALRTNNWGKKTIVVLQGELAVCDDDNVLVASHAATTCCIIAVSSEDAGKRIVAMGHVDEIVLDGPDVLDLILHPVVAHREAQQRLTGQSSAPADVHMVGCYWSYTGMAIAETILRYLHHHPMSLQVRLACLGRLNTQPDGAPAVQELAFDTSSWACFRGVFRDLIPAHAMRNARGFVSENTSAGRGLMPIYDCGSGCLMVQPVRLRVPLDAALRAFFLQILHSSDQQVLAQMSTSPAHEGPSFVSEIRAALRWLLQNPMGSTDEPLQYLWQPAEGWVPASGLPLSRPSRLLQAV
eukprot:jgi/Botrbrau1/10658/Bobra.53_2s0016.1